MLKTLLKYRLVTTLNSLAVLFVLGGSFWAFFALRAWSTPPFVLHFNDLDGITRTGGLGMVVFMGLFGLLMTLMNFAIALEFEPRDAFFGKFLSVLSLVFAVLLFIGFASIIGVNV